MLLTPLAAFAQNRFASLIPGVGGSTPKTNLGDVYQFIDVDGDGLLEFVNSGRAFWGPQQTVIVYNTGNQTRWLRLVCKQATQELTPFWTKSKQENSKQPYARWFAVAHGTARWH